MRKVIDKTKQQKDYLNTILGTIQSGVIVISRKDLKIKSINYAALKMLGLEVSLQNAENYVLGRNCSDFMCSNCNYKCISILENQSSNFECSLKKVNTEVLPILKNTSCVIIDDEECFVHSFVDISKQKKMELELIESTKKAEEAAKLKSEFLANMSHEIRTPLNAIIGYSELMLDIEDIENVREYSEIINRSSYSLLRIINNILDMSKFESGKMILNEELVNPYFVVLEVANGLKVLCDQKNIDIVVDENISALGDIFCDGDKLTQILYNIVGNAIKFTNKGVISLKVKTRDDSFMIFTVSDTGIGIPQDKQEMIFGAFNQVDGSYTRKVGGTGLGLAITSNLIKLMGGEIWLDSKEDVGTNFHFSIPLKNSEKL